MRTVNEWRDLIRDAQAEAAMGEGPFGPALAQRLDGLALELMRTRPDLCEMSLDEWLVEHMGAIATETRRIGEEILAAYDTDPEASEGPSL
jgi:hypothetical protein